ncbi:hypothetical protein LIS04_202 [Listeria phage LIS04]|nr:hypothetical protein LIS04_202 [Listeria phage LIS04]
MHTGLDIQMIFNKFGIYIGKDEEDSLEYLEYYSYKETSDGNFLINNRIVDSSKVLPLSESRASQIKLPIKKSILNLVPRICSKLVGIYDPWTYYYCGASSSRITDVKLHMLELYINALVKYYPETAELYLDSLHYICKYLESEELSSSAVSKTFNLIKEYFNFAISTSLSPLDINLRKSEVYEEAISQLSNGMKLLNSIDSRGESK